MDFEFGDVTQSVIDFIKVVSDLGSHRISMDAASYKYWRDNTRELDISTSLGQLQLGWLATTRSGVAIYAIHEMRPGHAIATFPESEQIWTWCGITGKCRAGLCNNPQCTINETHQT